MKSRYKSFLQTNILKEPSSECLMAGVWKRLWKLNVPNKIKYFLKSPIDFEGQI